MRYFLTGGTGFIGSRVARRLAERGDEVVALARDPDAPAARSLATAGIELAPGDITDPETLREPMRGVDGVFHLAAWYRVGADASHAAEINVEGTRNVLEAMRALRVPRGVYTSTLAVNSDTNGRRVYESYRHDGPHLSAYDETKWRAHFEVAAPMIEEGLPLVIVMPGAVYGPGDTSQLGHLLRRAAQGRVVLLPGGSTGLCWAHVDDVADAHLAAMDRGEAGESYIIAGPCHTYTEAFRVLSRTTGRRLRAVPLPPRLLRIGAKLMSRVETILPVPPDYRAETLRVVAGTTYYGDNRKAKSELGFAPRSIEQGFLDTFGEACGG